MSCGPCSVVNWRWHAQSKGDTATQLWVMRSANNGPVVPELWFSNSTPEQGIQVYTQTTLIFYTVAISSHDIQTLVTGIQPVLKFSVTSLDLKRFNSVKPFNSCCPESFTNTTQLKKCTTGHPTSVWIEVHLDDRKGAWTPPLKPRTGREELQALGFWFCFSSNRIWITLGLIPQQGKSLLEAPGIRNVLCCWLHKYICLLNKVFSSKVDLPFF